MIRMSWIGILVGLVACGHARLIQRTPEGGTLALAGPDRGKALEDAHRRMAEHCGAGNYVVVREGETVIGQDLVSSSTTKRNKDGSVAESSGSKVRNAVEWRLEYRCGGQVPAPSQASTAYENEPAPGEGARREEDDASWPEPTTFAPPPRPEPWRGNSAVHAATDDPCRLMYYLPPEGDIDGMPSTCYRYKLGLTCLARCNRLPPAARDGYQSAWSAVETSLEAATTPETRAGVRQGCHSAAEALIVTTQAAGCDGRAPRR